MGSWGKGAWGLAVPPNTGRRWREETPWDLPVDTELQVLHAWGDPDKALTAAPHPAMRQPSPCLALQLPRAHTPHSPGPAPRGHCRPPRPPSPHGWYPDFSPQVYHAGDRWDPQGLLSSSQTPTPASSKTTCTAHLSFKACKLVLGFARSRSLLFFFFPLPTEVLGNRWVMDSRLWESWMVRPEFLAFQPPRPPNLLALRRGLSGGKFWHPKVWTATFTPAAARCVTLARWPRSLLCEME